ncbi:RNA-directed DNA polymerase, eukaryota [Tanacetum coccineum]
MFVGQWSDENIGMLVNVLKWFFRASGLRINMAKSKIMGIHVNDGKVGNAAAKLGCLIMRSPFVYLGTKVGGNMARVSEWKEVIDKNLEAIRSRFFHGHEMGSNQMSWVRWNLGPSTAKSKVVRWLPSLYALNRAKQEFSVSSIRKYIDNVRMPGSDVPTIWIKSIPNKVNILAWKIRCDALPSRLNLSRRGIPIDSILCPICGAKPETVNHIFLSCEVARQIFIKICRWWHVDYMEVTSFEEWKSWMDSIRISSRLKAMFTGVCFTFWWWIWNTRNKLLFDKHAPKKADIYDNVVSYSFNWCNSRCKANLNWDEWLKNPNLM